MGPLGRGSAGREGVREGCYWGRKRVRSGSNGSYVSVEDAAAGVLEEGGAAHGGGHGHGEELPHLHLRSPRQPATDQKKPRNPENIGEN